MARYKNIGMAPWRRAEGTLVPPGATFEATPREHERIQRRAHYQNRLELQDGSGPAAATSTEADVWPLKLSPARYLELHPSGPNEKLAKRMLAAAAKKEG